MTNPDLEVLRLSAEACGYDVVYSESCEPCTFGTALAIRKNCIGPMVPWNPLEIAEQRWECLKKLLETCTVEFDALNGDMGHCIDNQKGVYFALGCPVDDAPARALAEIQRRKG